MEESAAGLLKTINSSAEGRSSSSIRQELVEPDPLRLAYRFLIKSAVREVVLHPAEDPLTKIRAAVAAVTEEDRANVQALILEELRRIHVGVLARYGLRPSELRAWQSQGRAGVYRGSS